MIALLLAALVGGATFLALDQLGVDDGVVTIAAAIFAAVLFEAVRDTLQNRHDRLRARLRYHELRQNDALNRILGEHHRGHQPMEEKT